MGRAVILVRVMAISAHPDDETLGCGGTLLRHHANGDDVHWVVASSRTTPRWSADDVELQQRCIQNVADAYGDGKVVQLGFPDTQLDTVPFADLINGIDTVLSEIRPEVVYVVHGGDIHSEHVIVHAATMSAIKAFRMKTLGVRRVMAFETLSSTDSAVPTSGRPFLPTTFHDISAFLDEKCNVMRLYSSELQDRWLPRTDSALTALARVRGATVGVQYAEAFMLLRELS
jgi:LmbE family N-acetylglucosaminyl deacetylase